MNTTLSYTLADLSPAARDKAIEHFRNHAVEHEDWAEHILEDWNSKLEELGFRSPVISYSGFWSQGDGASFTSLSVPNHSTDPEVQSAWSQLSLAALLCGRTNFSDLEDLASGCVERHRHQYSHEYTVRVEWEDNTPYLGAPALDKDDDDFDPSDALLHQWTGLSAAIRSYYEGLSEYVRSLCCEIYADLETEYEFQTSDEQVIENIEANDYEFDEDGALL